MQETIRLCYREICVENRDSKQKAFYTYINETQFCLELPTITLYKSLNLIPPKKDISML